ncbi:MAG: hypothetical protein KatS3mg032_1943 [Cyclobacteriaceae bacterium]|nr:MAG: hypothetical protein KatS3mg032_1943 [Cyclobacteriaceae bacterium]
MVGIMGPGENATPDENEWAYNLGAAIARKGWVVLTGGREFGVMDAALKGAADNNGLTIGILPAESAGGSSRHAQIKIITGMGSARNQINVLSSHILIVVGMAAGTASEVALAIKAGKKIILFRPDELSLSFFRKIGSYKIQIAMTTEEAIAQIEGFVKLGSASVS